jgi:hypothetical protein
VSVFEFHSCVPKVTDWSCRSFALEKAFVDDQEYNMVMTESLANQGYTNLKSSMSQGLQFICPHFFMADSTPPEWHFCECKQITQNKNFFGKPRVQSQNQQSKRAKDRTSKFSTVHLEKC